MASNAVRYDRGSPTIVVVNESDRADEKDLAHIVRAAQKQIDRDFFPLWGWRAKLVFTSRRRRTAMKIVIRDVPDEKDTPAYHFIDGLPITYVFTLDDDGNPVRAKDFQSAVSHEILEMIADPGVNLYAAGFYRTARRKISAWIPFEVVDPVQGNFYRIDGVQMSDFVLPEWFEGERERGSVRFSFLEKVREPFEIADGGYVDAVVGNRVRTRWGIKANRKKVRHRLRAREKAAKLA